MELLYHYHRVLDEVFNFMAGSCRRVGLTMGSPIAGRSLKLQALHEEIS